MSVTDINALYGARPVVIDAAHRVVLIRINQLFGHGMSDEQLYEATRKWWCIAARRTVLGEPQAPSWAMAVYGGVVRAVYRIERWEPPTEADIAEDERRQGRWAFRGERDTAVESCYLHRDVSSHLRRADARHPAQNPIRFVNC